MRNIYYIVILAIYIISCCCQTAFTGVYPNYRADFDFISLDKEKTLDDLAATKKWWQTATFYQIYPRSFKDTDGDGIGDLNGITEKLHYLKEIGITAAWISPIFKSPMADFGYDIASYTEIDKIFGTMTDFEALIAKSKEIGVKILLDFVPNHTSDESEWFIKSAANDKEYKDFYIWHAGKIVNGVRQPPTNWLSLFHGSAWQWHEGRQAYYLHQFLNKQPDLNYWNPKVRAAMNDVLRFWLKKGVAGFRCDAVPNIFEIAPDKTGNWPDEPRNEDANDPNDYNYLKHIYTVDQPQTIDLVYEWRRVLDDFQKENGGDERVLMIETYSPIDIVIKYYGNATTEGAQIPFNFLLLEWLNNQTNAMDYALTINTWLQNMPTGRTANWVIGNHDNNRVSARFGTDRIDMLNMLILTLPGVSVTYNGEEIGMTDVWISWKDTVDPAACNTNPSIYEKFSRDPERTPFQWNDDIDAGFSTAKKTWLPIADNYKIINVAKENQTALSHLQIYMQLQQLKNTATLSYGDAIIKAVNNNVLAIKRFLLNDYTYITLMNIFDNKETFDLHKTFDDLPDEMEYIIITTKSKEKIGVHIKMAAITLMPKEAIILRSLTPLSTTAGYYNYYITNFQY